MGGRENNTQRASVHFPVQTRDRHGAELEAWILVLPNIDLQAEQPQPLRWDTVCALHLRQRYFHKDFLHIKYLQDLINDEDYVSNWGSQRKSLKRKRGYKYFLPRRIPHEHRFIHFVSSVQEQIPFTSCCINISMSEVTAGKWPFFICPRKKFWQEKKKKRNGRDNKVKDHF